MSKVDELKKQIEERVEDIKEKLEELGEEAQEWFEEVWADVRDFTDNLWYNLEDLAEKVTRSTGLNINALKKKVDDGQEDEVLEFLNERIENGDDWDSHIASVRKNEIERYIRQKELGIK